MYSPLNSYVYIHWILDFKYIYYYYYIGVTHHFTNFSVQHTVRIGIEPLMSFLGLPHPTEYCRGPEKYGKYHIHLNRGINAIYVYSDVIQTTLMGDSSVPLICVIHLRGVFGEIAFK